MTDTAPVILHTFMPKTCYSKCSHELQTGRRAVISLPVQLGLEGNNHITNSQQQINFLEIKVVSSVLHWLESRLQLLGRVLLCVCLRLAVNMEPELMSAGGWQP